MHDVYDAPGLAAAVTAFAPDLVMHQLTDLPDDVAELASSGEANARIRTEGTANLLAAAASGGLDFSHLLAAAAGSSSSATSGVRNSSTGTGGASGGLDFGNLLNMSGGGANPPPPVYYKGMNLQEATGYNPHPETFVRSSTRDR